MTPTCNACDKSDTATQLLSERGVRLTELRRDVLQTLFHSDQPLGAYDLFEKLKEEGKASAPPAVYRVLDFLVEQGIAHKLPSLSAYTACTCAPEAHDAAFLICRSCGSVEELTVQSKSCRAAAADEGFTIEQSVTEIVGICRKCSESPRHD